MTKKVVVSTGRLISCVLPIGGGSEETGYSNNLSGHSAAKTPLRWEDNQIPRLAHLKIFSKNRAQLKIENRGFIQNEI